MDVYVVLFRRAGEEKERIHGILWTETAAQCRCEVLAANEAHLLGTEWRPYHFRWEAHRLEDV